MYKKVYKRLFDIIISALGLIVLAIPMIVVAIIIKTQDNGPIVFKQQRFGENKKLFMLYKFRSMKMSTPKDTPTHMLKNPHEYLLPIGGLIRKLSIDELPQLYNILKGEMSIIGPRPALWNQYDLIDERDKYGANNIKPGLTGLAQISGRDELEIPVKAKLDGEYTNNLNFSMDCKCFFKTIVSVLKKDGVVEGGTGEVKMKKEDTVKENLYL